MQASEIFEITNPLLSILPLLISSSQSVVCWKVPGSCRRISLESLLCVLSRPVMSNLLEVDSLPSELDRRIYYHT